MIITENPTRINPLKGIRDDNSNGSSSKGSAGFNHSFKYLPISVRKDISAVYTARNGFDKVEMSADSADINSHLLSSKRVFPLDIRKGPIRKFGYRKATLPVEKITMLEDSTVSIRPPAMLHQKSSERHQQYRSTQRRFSRQPVLHV